MHTILNREERNVRVIKGKFGELTVFPDKFILNGHEVKMTGNLTLGDAIPNLREALEAVVDWAARETKADISEKYQAFRKSMEQGD